jgi:DNA repair protein RecO (recombination protein O)
MKYGDTSKIVSLFTKSFGKVSVLAKGSRKAKNKFGSSLELLSYSSISFYNNPSRDLKVLSNSELFLPLRKIPESFPHLSAGLIMSEAISQVVDLNEINTEIFELVTEILIQLNEILPNPQNYTTYFHIKLAEILGFALDLKVPDNGNKEMFFSFSNGCFIKEISSMSMSYKFDVNIAKILSEIASASINQLINIDCNKKCIDIFNDFFIRYFCHHLDKKYSYKTLNLFNSIL